MFDVFDLLRAAINDRTDLDLTCFDPAAIQQAMAGGLGPLLFRATHSHPASVRSPAWNEVLAAELTARVLVSAQQEAAEEIITATSSFCSRVVLLKGMATARLYYPVDHLRTMGDIDLYVPRAHQQSVESVLCKLGYRQTSEYPQEFFEHHHHSMPFFHPTKHTWVEIHTALFPPTSPLASEKVFSEAEISTRLRPLSVGTTTAYCFTDELLLLHTCSHWASRPDYQRGLMPILDVLFLWKKNGPTLDWETIFANIQGSLIAAHLYLMLSYLDTRFLASLPHALVTRAAHAQQHLNAPTRRILHWVLDKYVVRGLPFSRLTTEYNIGIVWNALLSRPSPWTNLCCLPIVFAVAPRSFRNQLYPNV